MGEIMNQLIWFIIVSVIFTMYFFFIHLPVILGLIALIVSTRRGCRWPQRLLFTSIGFIEGMMILWLFWTKIGSYGPLFQTFEKYYMSFAITCVVLIYLVYRCIGYAIKLSGGVWFNQLFQDRYSTLYDTVDGWWPHIWLATSNYPYTAREIKIAIVVFILAIIWFIALNFIVGYLGFI